MTAAQIWHDIEYGYTLSTKPYYEYVLLAEVEKVKETEIQQLKDQLKDITVVELKFGELERQIETAKQNLINLLKSYWMEEESAKRLTQRVFEEQTPDNYNGDYDEYAERSSKEKAET